MSGDWRMQAACRGLDTSLFFPERGDYAAVEAASILVGIETQLRKWYADDMCFGGDRMDEIHQLWQEARRG